MIKEVQFSQGDIIFEEGIVADSLFMLKKGQVDIVKNNEVIDKIITPGSFFGEMSFLTGRIRTSLFVAGTDIEAYEIGFRNQGQKIDVDFSSLIKLSRSMAARIDLMESKVKEQIPYRKFREKIIESFKGDPKLLDRIHTIENEVNAEQMADDEPLIKEAMHASLLAKPFCDSIKEIIDFHIEGDLQLIEEIDDQALQSCIENTPFFGSEINFHGDSKGKIDIFLDEKLSQLFAKSFVGIDNSSEDVLRSGILELSNEILGRMANKVSGVEIKLECPMEKNGKQVMANHITENRKALYWFKHEHGQVIATATLNS